MEKIKFVFGSIQDPNFKSSDMKNKYREEEASLNKQSPAVRLLVHCDDLVILKLDVHCAVEPLH